MPRMDLKRLLDLTEARPDEVGLAWQECSESIACFDRLCAPRQGVLVALCLRHGLRWLLRCVVLIEHLAAERWRQAAVELYNCEPDSRLAWIMETGLWAGSLEGMQ